MSGVLSACKLKHAVFASRDQHSRDSGGASDEVTRLQYSMAVVRMVNGISDKAQKGKTATSVSSNAAAAGNPPPYLSMFAEHCIISMHVAISAKPHCLVRFQARTYLTHIGFLLLSSGRTLDNHSSEGS